MNAHIFALVLKQLIMKKLNSFILLLVGYSLGAYAQQPVGLPGNWTLQNNMSDEFNGGLNTGKWDHDPNDWGPWSWEPGRTKVNGGNLRITMDHKNHTRGGKKLNFTSGIIRSKADIKYGYFEVKMKGTPRHPGTAPAFWTYSVAQPTMNINGQQVKYNEIDFPEIQQRPRNVSLIDWNVIRANNAGRRTSTRITTGGGVGPSFDPRNQFHVYGCLWNQAGITFYIDGKKVGKANAAEAALQRHKQRLVISLGLRPPFYRDVNGGREAVSTPNRPSGFPTTMLVDYVRTWKGSPAGGGGNNTGGNTNGGNNNGGASTGGNNNRENLNCNNVNNWKPRVNYNNNDRVKVNNFVYRLVAGKGRCSPTANNDCSRRNWTRVGRCRSTKVVAGYGPSATVNISPNPASDILNIASDGVATVKVYNLQGIEIVSKEFSDTTSINITSLSSGVYIVKVINEVSTNVEKVIVE